MKFRYLFTPIQVGPVTLHNRIFITPHATQFASDDRNGLPGKTLSYYCAERAKGGAGLIEVSMAVVSPEKSSILATDLNGQYSPLAGGDPETLTGRWPLRGYDPRIVEGYSRLAQAVHEYGAKCAIELSSSGMNLGNEYGVSKFPWPTFFPFTGREMDKQAIESAIEDYGRAAKYVKDSGLDAVDIHASHGTLISEFLSSVMNRRKDKYGGSLDNRMRFLLEILARVRESVGTDIAVGMRLIGDERFKGGLTPNDSLEIARRLDGRVDWITADQGISVQQEGWQAVPMYVEIGYNRRITSPMKNVLKQTKVGVVGKYVDPLFAENLLANDEADMVAMTRALIADPELPKKALEGRIWDIRPCIGVLQDCWGRMNRGLPMSCTVNPAAGREIEWGIGTVEMAPVRKKVLVIGGGPAGLETARMAALRGHDVVVYEKGRELGGQVLLAAKLPGRENIKAIITWLTNQIKNLKVQIKLGLEVSSEPEVIEFVLEEEAPDAVVVATGSTPIKTGFQPFNFNGIDGWQEKIVSTDVEVLENRVEIGRNVIIADSLRFIEAPGIAELLAKQGKNVEIVTFHVNIALELESYNHWEHLFPRLSAAGIKISPFTWIRKVAGRTVVLYDVNYEKKERIVENIDNVILITGKMQTDFLYYAFNGKVKEVYLVGDANIGGARISNAMYDGQKIGRSL